MLDGVVNPALLSELIGMVYDCALDPGRWSATLVTISETTRLFSGGLALQALPSGKALLDVPVNFDVDLSEYGPDIIAMWGGIDRIARLPVDEPVVYSSLEGVPPPEDNRYYVECIEPRGIIDAVVVPFARSHTMIGSVGFNRHASEGPIGEHEVSTLRLLAPHFRRAAEISKLLDVNPVSASIFEVMLDRLSAGVVFVDKELGVVHANTAAHAMFGSGDPILLRSSKLLTTSDLQTSSLQAAVSLAASREDELAHRGIGIPLRGKNGKSHVVHVLPLTRGNLRPTLHNRAAAALFIASADAPPQMPGDALALIYDLTHTETRVFQMIVEGKTPAEIASSFGIAASTVKTHLLHIFNKTGCKRQADLIRLATAVAMPF